MDDTAKPTPSLLVRLQEDCMNPFRGRCALLDDAADAIGARDREIEQLKKRVLELETRRSGGVDMPEARAPGGSHV